MVREMVMQAMLDKLWSSVLEFAEEKNACGNATEAARERWQDYAQHIMYRWLEYHSPSARDRAVMHDKARGCVFEPAVDANGRSNKSGKEFCGKCGQHVSEHGKSD